MVFVLSRNGELAIGPAMESKEATARFLKAAVQIPEVRASALVVEAWTAKREDGQQRVEPRLDPERKEAIFVTILTAGRQAVSISPIERPANTVQKSPLQWIDESSEKWDGLFLRR